MTPGKYHILTFGCQMNKADSERIAALFESLGMVPSSGEKDADVIMINSCSVRQSAEDRIFGKLREYDRMRELKPNLVVGVTGCLPGRDQYGRIRAKMPGADLYFQIRELTELPRRLAGLRPDLIQSSGETGTDYLAIAPKRDASHHAFVTIQTGCNKFCTYCVVPYARGREKNRSAADVLHEVRDTVAAGAVSVTLLGQAVNAYIAPDPESFSGGNPYRNTFAALLWEIDRIPGVERIWFTSTHPIHLDDEVNDALALGKFMNFLHVPLQSGNDEVLRRMNRRYTAGEYLEIIRKIQGRVPAMALGTDIIVGFPGETERQFQDTLSLYRDCRFDISYHAMYSQRSGTNASRFFPDDVARADKKRRWQEVQALMEEIVIEKNQAYLGFEVEVLVDESRGGWCYGQSREMKLTRFRSDENLVGRTVMVKVEKAMAWMLES